MSIGKRIKKKRMELNMSQRELAKRIGYSNHSTIARIEAEKVDIPQSKIVTFADILNTTVAYLMGWEDEIKEDIEKDPVGIANEFADMLVDQEFREAFKIYMDLSEDKKKQVRDFVKFVKGN